MKFAAQIFRHGGIIDGALAAGVLPLCGVCGIIGGIAPKQSESPKPLFSVNTNSNSDGNLAVNVAARAAAAADTGGEREYYFGD